jgi:hypothetical protein
MAPAAVEAEADSYRSVRVCRGGEGAILLLSPTGDFIGGGVDKAGVVKVGSELSVARRLIGVG